MDITDAVQDAELQAAEEAALDDSRDADVISDYQTQGACDYD